jgi:hypothetical protein
MLRKEISEGSRLGMEAESIIAGGGLVSAGGTGIYAAGVIGIEYNFKVPILLSIDYRPEIGVAGGLNGLESDIALSVKYQF